MRKILAHTESVCPECLTRLPALRVLRGEDVYLEKRCPQHGSFSTIIWRGQPDFTSWVRPKTPSFPKNPLTEIQQGCPYDCGLCPDHRQQSCCVLLEVTQRCDLHCPICFADGGKNPPQPTLIKGRVLQDQKPLHRKDAKSAKKDKNKDEKAVFRNKIFLSSSFFSSLRSLRLRGANSDPSCNTLKGGILPDLPLSEISAWYERLLAAGGPFNIQLSGGEPCLRDDLAEIIRLGRSYGFTFFQLNTNGLRLARDAAYLAELKAAGLSTVFLQFDGTDDAIYRAMRGRDLLAQKMAAIAHCAELEIGVVLVPTLVPGVNVADIGNILRLGLAHMPTIRGVHFQPISYFGRYPAPPSNEARITIPEVIRAIESQSDGLIATSSFCPPGGENAACSFHGNFVLMPDGALKALTRHKAECCCQPVEAAQGAARSREFVAEHWSAPNPAPLVSGGPSLGEWDVFLERKRTHTFCISGMAFQDAWTLDLERLRDCYIHTASPDGRLVPFCAYNLTGQDGRALYRK